MAVVSNMALFVFTGSQLNMWSVTERVVFFSVMEHVMLCLKFLIAVVCPLLLSFERTNAPMFSVCLPVVSYRLSPTCQRTWKSIWPERSL